MGRKGTLIKMGELRFGIKFRGKEGVARTGGKRRGTLASLSKRTYTPKILLSVVKKTAVLGEC